MRGARGGDSPIIAGGLLREAGRTRPHSRKPARHNPIHPRRADRVEGASPRGRDTVRNDSGQANAAKRARAAPKRKRPPHANPAAHLVAHRQPVPPRKGVPLREELGVPPPALAGGRDGRRQRGQLGERRRGGRPEGGALLCSGLARGKAAARGQEVGPLGGVADRLDASQASVFCRACSKVHRAAGCGTLPAGVRLRPRRLCPPQQQTRQGTKPIPVNRPDPSRACRCRAAASLRASSCAHTPSI